MNERIRELAEKALDRAVPETWTVLSREQLDKFSHEFAESIVHECTNEILKWKAEPFPYDPDFGAKIIKEHFGIER
jgi:hypothetical protein